MHFNEWMPKEGYAAFNRKRHGVALARIKGLVLGASVVIMAYGIDAFLNFI